MMRSLLALLPCTLIWLPCRCSDSAAADRRHTRVLRWCGAGADWHVLDDVVEPVKVVESPCVMLADVVPVAVIHCKHCMIVTFFFFSSRRRHTRFDCDWSSDVCSSD